MTGMHGALTQGRGRKTRGMMMHTRKHTLGKFQGNESEMLAQAVYNCSLDGSWGESLGESDTFGWYAYIPGKRYHFILRENSQGFVYVEYGKPYEMATMWERIEKDYAEFVGDSDSDD